MHQALIGPGSEGVRAVGRDGGFCRHPGVTDGVGPGHSVEAETRSDPVGPANFLENLHAPAAADNGKFRHGGDLRAQRGFPALRNGEDEVRVAHDVRQRRSVALKAADNGVIGAAARPADGQFDRAKRSRAVNGEAGRIRSAIAHRAQHAGEQ